ncbi:MAG: BCCT family transporter [Bacteroidales bacterium]|nr:BCCT family transporter [Bacteroidales bacterium]MCF8333212.1 BCCT family transporter [Bacteroidales bacterium]
MENYESKKSKNNFKRFVDVHPAVFIPSSIIIVAFIAITLIVGEPMEEVFLTVQDTISNNAGWLFILVVNFFLFFMIYLAFSKYGEIRLGGQEAVPEFKRSAWFAMLFSAGMGIGILFWSVAEPVFHFLQPPMSDPKSVAASEEAMNFSFLHWGLHAWGIYALVGMALAFFAFNRKMPLAIRSVFYPIFGERIHGPLGNGIDILATIATVFGLATSLGFGVKQVNSGLNYLFDITISPEVQVVLILIITLIATGSVISGLDSGVKRLSELNINLGAVLLVFVIVFGPTVFILDSYGQNFGAYIESFFYKSFWAESYQGSSWQNDWTIFYWAWWISWSPFVGMFIARISIGRTVREFVLGVLIVPTLLTFLWLSAFGGSAVFMELHGVGSVADIIEKDVALSLFSLLDNFPLAYVTHIVAILLIVSFFVTSSDSGSLVVDMFTSGGKTQTPVYQRVFWAFAVGGVAAVLLLGGGLKALQTAAITTGLPFALILVLMSRSLLKGMRMEHYQMLQLRKEKEKESYRDLLEEAIGKKSKDKDKE